MLAAMCACGKSTAKRLRRNSFDQAPKAMPVQNGGDHSRLGASFLNCFEDGSVATAMYVSLNCGTPRALLRLRERPNATGA